MTAQLAPIDPPCVYVADGVVHIRHLLSGDADLVALAADSADPAEVMLRALSVGARALAFSRAGMDTAVVERSFEALVVQLGQLLDGAEAKVIGGAAELLNDPDAGVRARLDKWAADMTSALAALFDPGRSTSAIGKLDAVMNEAAERQVAATRRLLSPDNDDSPVARLFGAVSDQIATVLDAVSRVAEQVASDKAAVAAEARTVKRTAVKGMVFEEQVARAVAGIAARWGDVADPVGTFGGSTGGKAGDIVVVLDGAIGRYVLECKDRRVGLNPLLGELRRSMANREAAAAVAVLSRQEHCPVPGPFAVFGDCAVVVYDKDGPDPAALRLACAWARWMCKRGTDGSAGRVDSEHVRELLDDGRRALARRANIRRAHSAAARKIEEAAGQVDDMSAEITDALERIERALVA